MTETATEVFDIEAARASLRERRQRKALARQQLHERACRDAERIVRMLIEKHRPARILQWGSLLDRDRFSERSDIDIAIEGIQSPAEMFQIYGEVEEMTSFPVDLVQLETIEPEFADIIRMKGRVVYERG